jgi:thiol-disulfide isomerase/thioredoxin
LKNILKANGKPLLVNFWATWCDPCREEFPDLVKIDADYKNKIDFITVSLDDVEELKPASEIFKRNEGANARVSFDDAGRRRADRTRNFFGDVVGALFSYKSSRVHLKRCRRGRARDRAAGRKRGRR